MSHDDGSTDFSDDETLDDHPRTNGLRTPEKINGSTLSPPGSANDKLRPNLSVFHSPNNNNSPGKEYFTANTSDWSRSTPSDQGADSPGSYRIMPPPPPPQSKKPSLCKFVLGIFFVEYVCHVLCFVVSGSNLASHMVGSLKKGSKQSMSLPSTAYNTLPAHVHQMRSTTSSPRVISGQSSKNKAYHKRSPSSDSGTGSNTPVSSYHSGKVHHTVYLHGNFTSSSTASQRERVQKFHSFF